MSALQRIIFTTFVVCTVITLAQAEELKRVDLKIPKSIPDPASDSLQKEYLDIVQKQVPRTPLGKDWTRTLIANGDFGADLLGWETFDKPQIGLAKGILSHQALVLSGAPNSGLKQSFMPRLEDFLFVSGDKINDGAGLLLRFQGYIKSKENAQLQIGIVIEDSKGTTSFRKDIAVEPDMALYTKLFRVNYSGKLTNAQLVLYAPSQGAIQLERLELRAVAPIAKYIDLGEEFPRWMTFRNGTDLRVADLLANARAKITHALRPDVVKTLREFKPTENMVHIDHENFMNLPSIGYKCRAWGVGAAILNNITPDTETLTVQMPENYGGKAKAFWSASNKDRVLFVLGKDGRPDLKNTELIKVISATPERKKGTKGVLKIERNADGKGAKAFPAGETYLAEVKKAYYDPAHPLRDDAGETAKDIIVSEYAKKYKLTPWQGVEFDTANWYYLSGADTDFDFKPDCAVFNGVSVAGLGAVEVMRGLREKLGSDFIIQCDGGPARVDDGHCKVGYKSYEWINGVEKESYSSGNSSSSFEHFRHIQELVRYNPVFNYALVKDPTARYNPPEFAAQGASDTAFAGPLAASCLLGMVYTFHPNFNELNDAPGKYASIHNWDEYYGGDLDNENWLGKPVGPMMQWLGNLKTSENLLKDTVWKLAQGSQYDTKDFSIDFSTAGQNSGFNISIQKVPDGPLLPSAVMVTADTPMKPGRMEIGKVYTWVFKARAQDWIKYNGEVYRNIPKQLYLSLSPEEHGETVALISGEWRQYTISFIARADHVSIKEFPYKEADTRWLNPKHIGQQKDEDDFAKEEQRYEEYKKNTPVFQPTLAFGAQQGTIEIQDIRLYEGDDACWYREFENGLVMHNAGALPWTTVIPTGYRRLKSTNNQPYNDGANMSEKEVTLKNGEALFLVKHEAYSRLKEQGSTARRPPLKPDFYRLKKRGDGFDRLSPEECAALRKGKGLR